MTSELHLRQRPRAHPRPVPSLHRSFSSIGLVILLTFGATACSKGPAVVGTPSTTQATIAFASGSPWSGSLLPVAAPTPVNSIVAVTCVTASKCWGVGSTVGSGGAPNGAAVIATTNGGKSWFNQSIPATAGYLADIACSSQLQCVAVGQGQGNQGVSIFTTNGGATWVQSPVPPAITDMTAVSCNSDRRCMVIGALITGNAALVSMSTGATWNQVGTLPDGTVGASGVSCIDDRHCWVTGHTAVGTGQVTGALVGTSNGGITWVSLPIPVGSGFLNAVSCVQGPADSVGSLPGGQITVPTTDTHDTHDTCATHDTPDQPADVRSDRSSLHGGRHHRQYPGCGSHRPRIGLHHRQRGWHLGQPADTPLDSGTLQCFVRRRLHVRDSGKHHHHLTGGRGPALHRTDGQGLETCDHHHLTRTTLRGHLHLHVALCSSRRVDHREPDRGVSGGSAGHIPGRPLWRRTYV